MLLQRLRGVVGMVDILSLHTADISFDLRLHCYNHGNKRR